MSGNGDKERMVRVLIVEDSVADAELLVPAAGITAFLQGWESR